MAYGSGNNKQGPLNILFWVVILLHAENCCWMFGSVNMSLIRTVETTLMGGKNKETKLKTYDSNNVETLETSKKCQLNFVSQFLRNR